MFQALRIENPGPENPARLTELDETALPDGDVLVEIQYSALNYKDALAITGRAPVVRQFPMIPGIDLAGRVRSSGHAAWKPGDGVLLTGFGVGELRFGGLSQLARVPGDWLIPIPAGRSAREAAALGTAGLTAMLALMALERHGLGPDRGEVLVTGAGGGVGGLAILLLAGLGYRVAAATGRPREADYFRSLGAAEVIDRREWPQPVKPLGPERWAGAVDTLGGHALAQVCSTLRYGGTVAACGLAQSLDFPASVAPFILRGISLVGIDSVMAPMAERRRAWARLFGTVDFVKLESMSSEISLSAAIETAPELLAGRVRGRVVVDVKR
jgi:acrylyl-CoA reductase (NADPH)